MEHAGTAVAAAVRALAIDLDRWGSGPIVILCGPGNNGGDGLRGRPPTGARGRVGRRRGRRVRGPAARRHGGPELGPDRARQRASPRSTSPVARDVAMFGQGIEKAAVVVDALLGTGVRGALREPIRSAVEVIGRARAAGVPVVAVDTPDRGRPLERRAVRPGGRRRPDRHVPSPQDRPADAPRGRATPARSSSRRSASRPRPTVAEPRRVGRQPGWREVAASSPSPSSPSSSVRRSSRASCRPTLQEVVFHTPLAIVVLIVGTGWLLWRISRRPPGRRR